MYFLSLLTYFVVNLSKVVIHHIVTMFVVFAVIKAIDPLDAKAFVVVFFILYFLAPVLFNIYRKMFNPVSSIFKWGQLKPNTSCQIKKLQVQHQIEFLIKVKL